MASYKSTAAVAVILLLNCLLTQSQYIAGPGYGGYGGYPIITDGNNSDRGLDTILPLLILAFAGRGGGFGGGYGYGCGGGCGGGCGCGNGCGCGGC